MAPIGFTSKHEFSFMNWSKNTSVMRIVTFFHFLTISCESHHIIIWPFVAVNPILNNNTFLIVWLLSRIFYPVPTYMTFKVACVPGGCFTNISLALQDILEIRALQKSYFLWEFQAETFYVCSKPCFGHTYKVAAWNSHHKYDFWHYVFLRDYFGELVKL